MSYILVIVGLIFLVIAGNIMIRGAVSIAENFGLSKLVIGLTVVAFGTSAPELVVGINAALTGVPTLALGNMVGSNIANILLVIGLPIIFFPSIIGICLILFLVIISKPFSKLSFRESSTQLGVQTHLKRLVSSNNADCPKGEQCLGLTP